MADTEEIESYLNDDLPIQTEKQLEQERRKQKRREREERRERRLKHQERKKAQMTNRSTVIPSLGGETHQLRDNNLSYAGYLSSGLFGPMRDSTYQAVDDEERTSPDTKEMFLCRCSDCHDGAETCITNERCLAITSLKSGRPHTVYSCIGRANFMELAYCEGGKPGKANNFLSASCCTGHMCNDIPPPTLPSTRPTVTVAQSISDTNGMNLPPYLHPAAFLVVPAVLCVLLIMLIIIFFYKRSKSSQKKRREKERIQNYLGDNLSAQPLTEDCSIELPDPTSGSGSGLPMLVPRSVAKNINLEATPIGTGKYGNVYKGEYHGSDVAVKIFLSKDVASWECENEIYTTLLLRHENILGFIASDMISCDSVTQFWLISHYHEHGSLYDFLNQNIITPSQCLLMLHSAASGLVHLHTDISGLRGKPAIAHRDIKSKNILVKDDGSCCIADLGLSVVQKYDDDSFLDRPRNQQVGTKRYMAPEVLSEGMNINDFESYKRADVYSFSLVMWETAQCAIVDGHADKYHMPYGGIVQNDPTFDEMRRVVVTERRRPHIPAHWASHKLFKAMTKMIQECWSGNPTARLSMLRVKKNLSSLLEEARDYKEYV